MPEEKDSPWYCLLVGSDWGGCDSCPMPRDKTICDKCVAGFDAWCRSGSSKVEKEETCS